MKAWRPAAYQSFCAGAVRGAGLVLALAAALVTKPASAEEEIILVLSRGPEDVETLSFTQAELEAMPQVTIVTENEFSDGPVAYRGPLVRNVIENLALDQADALRFTAANDYFVEIPTSDFREFDAILAMEANGSPLSRREKGPLWLMYPISSHDELKDPLYIHRLIWQVERIEGIVQ